MLSEYLAKKLHTATYKSLTDGTYFGEIPGTKGVWANAKTLEACREELQSVLEEWVARFTFQTRIFPDFSLSK